MTVGRPVQALHHVQLAAPAGAGPTLLELHAGLLGMAEMAKPAGLAG